MPGDHYKNTTRREDHSAVLFRRRPRSSHPTTPSKLSAEYRIRTAESIDSEAIANLQPICFPEPFPQSDLFSAADIAQHIFRFPAGQFVVEFQSGESSPIIVASASNMIVTEDEWINCKSWMELAGGKSIAHHTPAGSTLFGLDISVHPEHRRQGIAQALYSARFALAHSLNLTRFATGCRLPGFAHHPHLTPEEYTAKILNNEIVDMPMTSFLNIGMTFVKVANDFMDDPESRNCNALLEYVI